MSVALRMSALYAPTLKEDPAEAEVASSPASFCAPA